MEQIKDEPAAKLRDMLIQLSDEKKLPGKDEKPEDDNKTEE